MASTIKYDNTEILNTTYNPRYLKHESFPDRVLDFQDLAKDNGSILVSDKFGVKKIQAMGILIGTSQADLESKVDTMKELFARVGKNLDVDWNGTTRRYVVTTALLNIDRDHYHITWVPWIAKFTCASGIAEDSTETTLQNATDFNLGEGTFSLTFAGSAPPKPKFTIETIHTSYTTKGICLKNNDNGQAIYIPLVSGVVDNGKLEIDCRLKTVRATAGGYYGQTLKYYGQFPEFVVGANSITVSVGNVVDQYFTPAAYTVATAVYGSLKSAQKFTVSNSDITYKALALEIMKTGTLSSGYLTVEIQTDTNGAPSGTEVPHATFRLYPATAPEGIEDWVIMSTYDGFNFTLAADTPYWIVVDGNSIGDVSNYLAWFGADGITGTYKRGCAANYDGGWTMIPGQDNSFKLYFFGVLNAASPSDSLKVEYYKRYL
jgi:hypothetical protein